MESTAPPPLVPVPAARYTRVRGRRVIIGVPGVGFRGDLRADDPVVQGSRTFVPVLTEQEYYRAELHHIEAFAILVPVDRVWVEEPGPAAADHLQPLDAPPIQWPRAAKAGEHLLGRRVVRSVPDGFVRDLRALSNSHTSHTGVESVRVCAESAWYAWALDGTPPSSMEIPTDQLWIE
ncbi:MAG: hypothetical protein IRY92_13845 [Dactylosporangium sp.]|nr:hypothetical protein [Dactylosporangium sp.]